MTYTKQAWADGSSGGTPINASRLGHMEDGIESAHSLIGANASSIEEVLEAIEALRFERVTGITVNTDIANYSSYGSAIFANSKNIVIQFAMILSEATSFSAGSEATLFTLPEAYRSSANQTIYRQCLCINGSTGETYPRSFEVSTSGAVKASFNYAVTANFLLIPGIMVAL